MAEIVDLFAADASNIDRFPENQSPASLNNGARALEGIIARWEKDTNFSTLATLSGSVIQMTVNQASLTLTGTTANYRADLLIGFTMGANPITGPASINLNSVGPISLRDNAGASLSSSALLASARALIVKDSTNDYFRLIYPDATRQIASGIATNAGQPAFRVHNSGALSNVTGNGTTYTVVFATEVFDQNNDFDAAGAATTFTAPVTGRYLLTVSVKFSGITAVCDSLSLKIITSNDTYPNDFAETNMTHTTETLTLAITADMDATDTATVTLENAGEAGDVHDIATAGDAQFSGVLLA